MPSRIEQLLQILGFAVWAFIGTPTLWQMAQHSPAARELAWLGCYVAFAVCFAWGRRGAALVAQSALAVTMCLIGMQRFEGALLAVVAAQVPNAVPLPPAVAWIGLQALPLVLDVSGSHGPARSLRATAEYLTFGAFAVVASFLWQRESRLRSDVGRLNAELLATQKLLTDSTRLAERSRISRDLHDAFGHHLVALGLQLQLEQDRAGEASAPVSQAQTIVREMLAEVREVVSALRADAGVDVGGALQALAQSMPAPAVHVQLPESLGAVDPRRAHALLRCVQEAITNAVKHGGARNVWVRLETEGASVRLQIDDDGRGAVQIQPGNGLAGMRERLAGLGGGLDVSSVPGRGFALRVMLPLAGDPA